MFLDLRKAINDIDHHKLIAKLEHCGITEICLELFTSYISQRSQFVSCNCINSNRNIISHGVPQGSVIGPTLFNIHISGIGSACQKCKVALYADDTEIHANSKDINQAESDVNDDVKSVSIWFTKNVSVFICNRKKTEAMLIGSRHVVNHSRSLNIMYEEEQIKQSEHFEYLGIYIDNILIWNMHISYIISRIYPKLTLLNRISSFVIRETLLKIFKPTILPILDYGCIILDQCGNGNEQKLERLQNWTSRIILSTSRKTCSQDMCNKLGLLLVSSRRRFLHFLRFLQLVFKIVNNVH